MEELLSGGLTYSTPENACRRNDENWRPCAEDVRDLLVAGARDGIIPDVLEAYIYNLSKRLLIALASTDAPTWGAIEAMDPLELDQMVADLYGEEEVLFIEEASFQIWNALEDSGEVVEMKWELFAISLPFDVHTCRVDGQCQARLNELGKLASVAIERSFAEDHFNLAMFLQKNDLLSFSPAEFNAFANPIIDHASRLNFSDAYLFELERLSDDNLCIHDSDGCLANAEALGQALLSSEHSDIFFDYADRLEALFEHRGLNSPEVVGNLRTGAFSSGDVNAISQNIKERMYGNGPLRPRTLRQDPLLLEDAVKGLGLIANQASNIEIASLIQDIAFLEIMAEQRIMTVAEIIDLLVAHDMAACWSINTCEQVARGTAPRLSPEIIAEIQLILGVKQDKIWGPDTNEAYSRLVLSRCADSSAKSECINNELIGIANFLEERIGISSL